MDTQEERICPECGSPCGPDECHVCPVACCCTLVPEEPREETCPYCGASFRTDQGHVCPWLCRLQEPAQ